MLRITKPAFLALLSFGMGASGCADNESSLFVQGVLNLEASDCVARPDPEAEFLVTGTLDRAFTNRYYAAVQVGNQLTQQGNREKLRTETSRMHLEGASVTLFTPDERELEFESIATGFVHPAAGTDPGLAAVVVQLVRPDDDLGTDGQGVVRFRVFGTTLGGQYVESGDFDFPIQICTGCLVAYPPQADINPAPDVYECGPLPESSQETNVCLVGQDQRFACSLCTATHRDICLTP